MEDRTVRTELAEPGWMGFGHCLQKSWQQVLGYQTNLKDVACFYFLAEEHV